LVNSLYPINKLLILIYNLLYSYNISLIFIFTYYIYSFIITLNYYRVIFYKLYNLFIFFYFNLLKIDSYFYLDIIYINISFISSLLLPYEFFNLNSTRIFLPSTKHTLSINTYNTFTSNLALYDLYTIYLLNCY